MHRFLKFMKTIFPEADIKSLSDIITRNKKKVKADDFVRHAIRFVKQNNLHKHPSVNVFYRVNGSRQEMSGNDMLNSCPAYFTSSRRYSAMKSIESLAISLKTGDDLCDDVYLSNGIYDLKDNSFTPYTDESRYFYQISRKFKDDDDLAKEVIDFVRGLVDTELKFHSLMKIATVSMTRRIPKKLFILYGKRNSGKTEFMKLIERMVGSTVSTTISMHDLAANRFAAARLDGKLYSYYPDISSDRLMDHAILKSITGGDPIVFERKGKDAYAGKPYATLVYGANELPRFIKSDDAMKKRLMLVKFPYQFLSVENDEGIVVDDITVFEQSESIVTRFTNDQLDAFASYLLKTYSSSIKTTDFRIDIDDKDTVADISDDPIDSFFESDIEFDNDAVTTVEDIYIAYKAYYQDQFGNTMRILSKNEFSKVVKFRYSDKLTNKLAVSEYTDNPNRVRGYQGIRLRLDNVSHRYNIAEYR